MNCPICKKKLQTILFNNVEVDYCNDCLGLWFEKDELRWAKDNKDKDLRWLDVDLWKDQKNFKVAKGIRLCPECRMPLYEIHYGDSQVIVDFCRLCGGLWLDRAEFKKIIEWLKNKANYEIMHNYSKNLLKEFSEIFVGPETLKEEIVDFLVILKLLNYKFTTQHPNLTDIFSSLPR